MKVLYSIVLCILLFAVELSGQSNEPKDKDVFLEGETYFFEKEYAHALEKYLLLYEKDSSNYNLAYRIGACYYNEHLYFKAIDFLNKAKVSTTKKYKEGQYSERDASNETFFLLGKCYQTIREYELAQQAYSSYTQSLSVRDIYYYDLAENQMNACTRAKKFVANPVRVEIENIGKQLNTTGYETMPLVSQNDSVMIFCRKVSKTIQIYGEEMLVTKYDIHKAIKSNGHWKEVGKINKQLRSDGFYIPKSLSANGKFMVLFRDNYENGSLGEFDEGALYYSELKNNRWTVLKKFGPEINTNKWEGAACISSDGNFLYFSSDRKGSVGGMDLYVSERVNGSWSEPVNMGDNINSDFHEDNPMLVNDSTLYFASEKHDNMGGYDIFVSKKINDKWSQPVNLGYPVNSTGDDLMLSPCLDGTKAYFASYRPDGYLTFGKSDIYAISFIPEEKAAEEAVPLVVDTKPKEDESYLVTVVDSADAETVAEQPSDDFENNDFDSDEGESDYSVADDEEMVVYKPDNTAETATTTRIEGKAVSTNYDDITKPVEVTLVDASTNKTVSEVTADPETAEYSIDTEPGDYKLVVASEDHTVTEQTIYIPETSTADVKIESPLVPKNQSGGDYYMIKPVFFEYGSSEIPRSAQFELERLFALMDENKNLYLEVTGHTDAVSSYSFNKKLSMKRANSVINYLVERGIDHSRFVQRGVSFDENIAINDTEEGRRYNRRVEMKVVQSNTDLVQVQDIVVPDHLKKRSQLEFFVFVELTDNTDRLAELEMDAAANNKKGESINKDGKAFYSIGSFAKKAEAVLYMNNLIDKGYQMADVVDNFNLNKKMPETEKVVYGGNYAIQLMGLMKPCNIDKVFKDIEGVREFECVDGYYRYVFGSFNSKTEAQEAQEILSNSWESGSFIVPADKFEDETFVIRERTNHEKYTIQLYALNKPISETGLKVVEGADEAKGDDGYYRYIYGKYKSYTEAEKAQASLVNQGFDQTFITLLQKFQ